jgi:hypothetical protein
LVADSCPLALGKHHASLEGRRILRAQAAAVFFQQVRKCYGLLEVGDIRDGCASDAHDAGIRSTMLCCIRS